MTQDERIIIGKPYRKSPEDGFASMYIPISKCGVQGELFFSVREKYGSFLTDDRNDATVVAFLPFAMSNGLDIISEAPVSSRLLYSLNHIVIPLLSSKITDYKKIKILASPCPPVSPCAGATGLCWTGGVDSMYSLHQSMNCEDMRKITHLLTADHGGIEGSDHRETLLRMEKRVKDGIESEIGAQAIAVFTNLQDHLTETFLSVEGFRNAAVALSLQKLWDVFYISASYNFDQMTYEKDNCAYFDNLLTALFSTDRTAIHSVGGDVSRIQKLEVLSSFPPAFRYLHPCIYVSNDRNCSTCTKCIRTMTALDVLGSLEKFQNVFDIEKFTDRKDDYYAEVLSQSKGTHYSEIVSLMEEKGLQVTEAAKGKARILAAVKKVVKENNTLLKNYFDLSNESEKIK